MMGFRAKHQAAGRYTTDSHRLIARVKYPMINSAINPYT